MLDPVGVLRSRGDVAGRRRQRADARPRPGRAPAARSTRAEARSRRGARCSGWRPRSRAGCPSRGSTRRPGRTAELITIASRRSATSTLRCQRARAIATTATATEVATSDLSAVSRIPMFSPLGAARKRQESGTERRIATVRAPRHCIRALDRRPAPARQQVAAADGRVRLPLRRCLARDLGGTATAGKEPRQTLGGLGGMLLVRPEDTALSRQARLTANACSHGRMVATWRPTSSSSTAPGSTTSRTSPSGCPGTR